MSTAKEGGTVANNNEGARDAVFVESEEMPEGTDTCGGYDFNNGLDYKAMFNSMLTHGFQVIQQPTTPCFAAIDSSATKQHAGAFLAGHQLWRGRSRDQQYGVPTLSPLGVTATCSTNNVTVLR